MSNKWQFQDKPAGEFDGFKDAGIEYFTGNPYSSLAREVIQNSLDAKVDGSETPVRVYFDLVHIARDEFPGREELEMALRNCQRLANNLGEKEGAAFFEKSLGVISGSKIPSLRMADTGTNGLHGPCKLGQPYFAFMKAQGQSLKASSTAGGSYGIGKNAPFALSDLRTIFVSTTYRDNTGRRHDLAQGKSILMSQDLNESDDNYSSATGYFGKAGGCLPIDPPQAIPAWLARRAQFPGDEEVQGTSVFVTGFRSRKGWRGLLIASVISNYFEAIHSGKLEVVMNDGEIEVTRATLRSWFSSAFVHEAAVSEDVADQLSLAEAMYKCFTHDETKEEHAQLQGLGHCRVRILVLEGLEKRVGVIRNGMLVTSRFKKLLRFPGYSDFVAVVDCLDPAGNQLLRRMENPEHDNFEPERLRDSKDIEVGRRALQRLADFVRKNLKKHARVERGEVTELDELAEFFQDPDMEDVIPASSGETDLTGSLLVLAQPQRTPSGAPTRTSDGPGSQGGAGGEGGPSGAGDNGTGPGEGDGQGGRGSKGPGKARPVRDLRSLLVDGRHRELLFTPEFSGVADLTVQDMGADATYELAITNVSGPARVDKGWIKGLKVTKGERVRIQVEFGEEFFGAIRVVAHEV